MKISKKVGLFGGSFDPIHFGHIDLAVHLLEEYALDEILFCPAFCSPFKEDSPPVAKAEERLDMVKLALDHPSFKAIDFEIKKKGPSYTIDTVKSLVSPERALHLLLADEAAKSLQHWRSADELIKLAPPLMGKRKLEISSTEIRSRISKGLYCSHLVPFKVLQYIQENQIYRS